MGLLFLTDLRGGDVVLGKLAATSLRAVYSLLAIFPVMAVSFILGGVAADDFRHTLVAICNALFFSLSMGMLVSAISREAQKAMSATLAGMLIFMFGLPQLADHLFHATGDEPGLGLLSPIYGITHAGMVGSAHNHFWLGTLGVHLTAWGLLLAAALLAPRTWQEKTARGPDGIFRLLALLGAGKNRSARHRLNDQNAICWIISRDRWSARISRIVVVLALAFLALSLKELWNMPSTPAALVPPPPVTYGTTTTTTTNASGGVTSSTTSAYVITASQNLSGNWFFLVASWCSGAFSLALELWLATHVARFYVEGKKSGFLELLLVTPVGPLDIIKGHWLALRKLFLAPAVAQLSLSLVMGLCSLAAIYARFPAGGPGGASAPANSWMSMQSIAIQQTVALVLGSIGWATGLFTIAWLSMWTGLVTKKTPVAVLKTLFFAKILPWFAVSCLVGMLFLALMRSVGTWAGAIIMCLPSLLFILVNLAIIALARHRVRVTASMWRAP